MLFKSKEEREAIEVKKRQKEAGSNYSGDDPAYKNEI
jgi:hypothetical protein